MMEQAVTIEFRLDARDDGAEVTPDRIALGRFVRFNTQVGEFVAGSGRQISLDAASVRVERGSYRLVLALPTAVAALLLPDMQALHQEDALAAVDPQRAAVIGAWQRQARKEEGFAVTVEVRGAGREYSPVRVRRESDYHSAESNDWAAGEYYLVGRITDMGGMHKSNVHIELPDGQRLTTASSEEFLRDQTENYLYKRVQVRVAAEKHVRTGKLRNPRLLAFVGWAPSYDDAELEAAIEKGTRAWADVPDAVKWVREQRGQGDG
ncbi:MAG: hypothetical protein A3K19_20055 [Lentisphaerae bacterium RIFOXYB12_FULL_65_16]|nr:MAG: hypothetical protein A3K18_17150 [Lentisphaerae bacterium RIFOXYA12_64_32]OGV93047.1 MAG: hypothetical protein A3K19_20055 [Lentisphaerae bacterium RIFOXYB12_FULL_65_16]